MINERSRNFWDMDLAENIEQTNIPKKNTTCLELLKIVSPVEVETSFPTHEEQLGNNDTSDDVIYKVEDTPPWYLCLFLGFQHYITMFGGTFMYPYIVTTKMCMRDDDPSRGYIISTTFFVTGIATLLQTSFGIRLPIVQGCTYAFLAPTIAILDLPQWKCEEGSTLNGVVNLSAAFVDENAIENSERTWQPRMREIQGAVLVACVVEVIIGLTGFVGFLLRWVTPLTIVPTVTLVGLSLVEVATETVSGNLSIAVMTILLLTLFSQYLRDVPCPIYTPSRLYGWHVQWIPLFKIFPVLLTILTAWFVCGILTYTNTLPHKDPARTDLHLKILRETPWFRFPYPGQWGLPTVSTGAVCGLLAGVLASVIESVGDYYACARLSGAPPPPSHAINRGIMMEGLGCIIAGIWGSGSGLTSYSENVGAIGITKVGSRRVVQYGALLMIIFGLLGKAGALFSTIPQPIVGGIFCVMFATITAVGLSSLYLINLSSSRNHFVLGTSLFFGMCVPRYVQKYPQLIQTGSSVMNQILTVLLSTNMFVGGLTGLLLDNTIPGSYEDRGIQKWRSLQLGETESNEEGTSVNCYDFPYGMSFVKKYPIFAYLPIFPTYKEGALFKILHYIPSTLRTMWRSFWTSDV